MNNKGKTINLLLILTFLLPLDVKADLNVVSKKEYYENYYYFVQPYYETIYGYKYDTYELEQKNIGIFSPQKLGSDIGEAEIIDLKRNCAIEDKNCYSFQKFWDDYKNIISNGNTISTISNNECNVSYITNRKSNSEINQYTHGCWKEENSAEIKGGNIDFNVNYNSLGMACSSVSRSADVTVESNDEYLELKIVRKPLMFNTLNIKKEVNLNSNISNCGFDKQNEVAPYRSSYDDFKYHSPILAKYTYTKTTYNCPNTKYSEKASCNNSSNISQKCGQKTITAINAQSDINYEQTGVISNIISPTKIYQGGGISIGFIYYNTLKWDFKDGTLYQREIGNTEAKKRITTEVEKTLIKTTEQFENELKNNIELSLDGISSNYMNQINNQLQVNCQRSGNVVAGETLTTICTIIMPETKLAIGTGKIDKVVASTTDGITNKIYTDLTFSGKTHLYAKLSKLNMLKVDDEEEWSISFGDDNDTSCDVDVERRLYSTSNSNKVSYNFIYRPIDVNNPFPNRNAGINWYEWWNNSYNKDRLKDSYSNGSLQYEIELNPSSIKSIKESTTIRDYYEWNEDDEKNNNKFVTDNFNIKRQNIKESGDY